MIALRIAAKLAHLIFAIAAGLLIAAVAIWWNL